MEKLEIKSLFKDLFEGLASTSVREGTAIVEEIINPLTLLNNPLFSTIEKYLEESSIPSTVTSLEILTLVGKRYLVEQRIGSSAETSVRFVFRSPRDVSISAGAICYTQDRRGYVTKRAQTFALEQLTERADGAFETPEVEMVAESEGADYSVEANEITVPGFIHADLLYCYNPFASTGGALTETAQEYYERIRLAISSRAMDTPLGLLSVVAEQFSGEISRILIVGANDPEMTRDQQFPFFRVRQVPLDVVIKLNRI